MNTVRVSCWWLFRVAVRLQQAQDIPGDGWARNSQAFLRVSILSIPSYAYPDLAIVGLQ